MASVPNANNTGSISVFDPSVSGAEAVGGGTDGTDIGVYGGPIPFSLEGTLDTYYTSAGCTVNGDRRQYPRCTYRSQRKLIHF